MPERLVHVDRWRHNQDTNQRKKQNSSRRSIARGWQNKLACIFFFFNVIFARFRCGFFICIFASGELDFPTWLYELQWNNVNFQTKTNPPMINSSIFLLLLRFGCFSRAIADGAIFVHFCFFFFFVASISSACAKVQIVTRECDNGHDKYGAINKQTKKQVNETAKKKKLASVERKIACEWFWCNSMKGRRREGERMRARKKNGTHHFTERYFNTYYST